jgi:Tol biopolymer transport system component
VLAILAALTSGFGAGEAEAQIPPQARWATIESAHFRVTFPPGLEELARHAARRAEAARASLAAELTSAPPGKVDILLTDFVDTSNGYATPFPTNRITLYARPPVDMATLSYFDDWLDLVIIHELAHIFHLDAAGRLGRGLRNLFGRAPTAWPIFPVIGTPTWSIEGLATYIESRLTGAGRVRGSYHEMVLRTAVLEGAFESIDQVNGTGATWPGGMRGYIYGSLFLEHLSRIYGPEVQQKLVEATAGSWLPPSLALNRIARKATGTPFTELFTDWRNGLERRYHALADSLSAAGLTTPERMARGEYNTLHPRVGKDGRVAYASADGRSAASNRVLDPIAGTASTLSRRNDIGPSTWFPDGSLLTAQIEFDGPYRVYSDLYRVDARGREHRLTRGARLTEPDLAPNGRRVVAVQTEGGTNRLVSYDLASGTLRPLTEALPNVHWAYPRWSPDGARLAVNRWEAGGYDVVILDTLGTLLHRVTADRALDIAPAWSPDGRYVLFSSDRSGIPNLYAFDLAAEVSSSTATMSQTTREGTEASGGNAVPGLDARADATLYQVTNLLTGAFYPDVSPDGRWLYFSGYHADGFHVERIAFDPNTWREPGPVPEALLLEERSAAGSGEEFAELASGVEPLTDPGMGEAGPVRRYSPWRSMLPRYWLPYLSSDAATGTFYGALTSGTDLVGRHAYALQAAYQPADRLLRGELAYRYAGLGLPLLGVTVARDWEGNRLNLQGSPAARLLQRDDEVRLSASFIRQRRRSAAELTLGAEGVRRERTLHDAGEYGLRDPTDHLLGAVLQVGFANYRSQPFSISLEDGIALALTGRRRWDLDRYRDSDGLLLERGYDEVSGQFRAYRALGLPGFANHVLAARVAARWRQGPGAVAFGIGGASGTALDLGIGSIGGGHRFLPVRGFDVDDRIGTRAWSGSLEYRFPIALVERGIGLIPVFLDRLSGSLFLDAGDAYCSAAEEVRFGYCSPASAVALVAAGGELAADLSFLLARPTRLRGGIAFPIQGRAGGPQLFFQLGVPF